MTVLSEYQRLEAEAVWHPSQISQRRDVLVSIGDATLTISTPADVALAHWSLPALVRLNKGHRPALYAPGPDAPERLEIADPDMIDAVDRVLRAIGRRQSRPGRLRALAVATTVSLALAVGTFWLPGALTTYTASLVPDVARAGIGRALLAEVERLTGPRCRDESGLRALERMAARLFPEGGTRLAVMPAALSGTAHLPGGHILIGRPLVEDWDTPDALAGYILAEDVRRRSGDPMERLLERLGLGASLRLLTSGSLGPDDYAAAARAVVGTAPEPVPDDVLLSRFAAAALIATPYAYAVDISGEETMTLIEADIPPGSGEPVLGDGNWLALQAICEN